MLHRTADIVSCSCTQRSFDTPFALIFFSTKEISHNAQKNITWNWVKGKKKRVLNFLFLSKKGFLKLWYYMHSQDYITGTLSNSVPRHKVIIKKAINFQNNTNSQSRQLSVSCSIHTLLAWGLVLVVFGNAEIVY